MRDKGANYRYAKKLCTRIYSELKSSNNKDIVLDIIKKRDSLSKIAIFIVLLLFDAKDFCLNEEALHFT